MLLRWVLNYTSKLVETAVLRSIKGTVSGGIGCVSSALLARWSARSFLVCSDVLVSKQN